jgi:hypothetical protein
MEYCVYLTLYFGNKLPKRYIGSSQVRHVKNGYNGSPSSKYYSKTYYTEQKENKHLFKTRILSYHETRIEAFEEELRLQMKYDVVRSNSYFNMGLAKRNGCYGAPLSGEKHSQYGMRGPKNPKYGRKQSPEHVEKRRLTALGKKRPNHSEIMKGRKLTEDHSQKISKSLLNRPKSDTHKKSIINSEAWKNRDKTRKAVFIEGEYYHTLLDASRALGISTYKIKRDVNDPNANSRYADRRK